MRFSDYSQFSSRSFGRDMRIDVPDADGGIGNDRLFWLKINLRWVKVMGYDFCR